MTILPIRKLKEDYINFAFKYDKLTYKIFPTLRGLSWNRKTFVGDIRSVRVNREHSVYGKVIYKKVMRIKDIPLDFLKWDVAPIIIHDHNEFCTLINSFYPRKVYEKLKANLSTELTVLFFERDDE